MQTFERSVLIVALLILIVTLTVMGIALKENANKNTVPPSSCPDFWFSSYFKPCSMSLYGCCDDGVTPANDDSSNCETLVDCNTTEFGCCHDGYTAKTTSEGANCSKPSDAMCYNVRNLGYGNQVDECSIKDPATFVGKFGKSSLCTKQEWSKSCGVSWDGVTNADNDC
jgi:hypothetical protein